jgi:hypothetical protein
VIDAYFWADRAGNCPVPLIGAFGLVDKLDMSSLQSRRPPQILSLALIASFVMSCIGCSFGPRSLVSSRLRYNDAVKTTSEQQLLLNIVRLRYIDTPSSLSISSIADQQEIVAGLKAIPFFTAAGAGNIGSFRGSVWPQAELTGTSRPTLSYIPMDDEEFTRRLFTPISLEGAAYLSKTTWPIATVFRLYLENLNWISNAETASGPTPLCPPEYERFLEGVMALQRLQDRTLITLYAEDREEVVSSKLNPEENNAKNAIDSVQNGMELKATSEGVALIRRIKKPVMRVGQIASDDADWAVFCNAFKLNPTLRTFDLTSEDLDPYLKDMPQTGLETLDLETRSLLQVLFFVSQGVDVPQAHSQCGIAPLTNGYNGEPFDWQQVMGGLFRVHSVKSKKPPECAHVAIQYKDHWFYIDQRDRESKSTFALLLEVSRLELKSTKTQAPLLTLPLGG